MNHVNEVERNEEEEKLIDMIELEMRKIHLSVEKIYNNLTLSEPSDPIEKCLIENCCYSSSILEKGINNEVSLTKDPVQMLEDSLQKEIDYLMNDVSQVLSKINEYEEMFTRLDKNIANLKAMIETSKNETKSTYKPNEIFKHVKMRFRKERADLKAIIVSLFSENSEIQDLIAAIVEHHFSEGADKYLQLEKTDTVTEQIEFLRRTGLIEVNPHDLLQIRLADIL